MNQLTFEGFLFVMFWGCALWMVAALIVWVWEVVAERVVDEDLRVDVWTGSDWQNVFTNLANGWNNVTITSYLTSSTFSIRFKGNVETSDSTQDSWNIDTTVIHAWT